MWPEDPNSEPRRRRPALPKMRRGPAVAYSQRDVGFRLGRREEPDPGADRLLGSLVRPVPSSRSGGRTAVQRARRKAEGGQGEYGSGTWPAGEVWDPRHPDARAAGPWDGTRPDHRSDGRG